MVRGWDNLDVAGGSRVDEVLHNGVLVGVAGEHSDRAVLGVQGVRPAQAQLQPICRSPVREITDTLCGEHSNTEAAYLAWQCR